MAQLLNMGLTPEGDTVGGSMAAVVKNLAELPRADHQAMAEYILSLPAREGPPRPPR